MKNSDSTSQPGQGGNRAAKLAFELQKRYVELSKLLPTKLIKNPQNFKRYDAILKSLPELGLIEPLMVYPQKGGDNWLVLDGHLRLLALKQLGWTTAEIIVASEGDRYTYNARVNRLPPIQSHGMIAKAVKNGVKAERIAKALFMPLHTVNTLINLLDGINPEAANILKDKQITAEAIRLLRKVTGLRQIEIAELMVATNNFTKSYLAALVAGTNPDEKLPSAEPKKKKTGLTVEELARMEREMESLEKDFKSIEANYTENMMSLTLARGYIKRLMENGRVTKHLREHHGDLLPEFERIAAAEGV